MPTNNYQKGLVSVCCLGYKHKKFLEQSIQAIWANKYQNIEIIAVDDGSNDGSVELLNSLSQQSPYPMKVVAQENTGHAGKNCNKALKLARGEFIMFMSMDDYLYSGVIDQKTKIMLDNPNCAFVADDTITVVNDKGELSHNKGPKLKISEIQHPETQTLLNLEYEGFGAFYTQGVIFKKEVVDAIGGFDEDMIGDDIILRCKLFNYLIQNPQYTFEILREPSFYYRMHDNNIHKDSIRQMKTFLEVLERFFPEKENPQRLYKRLSSTINSTKFEDYMKLFSHNKKAAKLLHNSKVQQMIKYDILNNNENRFLSFIYKKHYSPKKTRHIFLSFIKIHVRNPT